MKLIDAWNALVRAVKNDHKRPELIDKIQHVLVLSTAHISRVTAQAIFNEETGQIIYTKEVYGWWVYCGEHTPDSPRCPADLRALIKYARDRGCLWLALDRDGPINPALPRHEW